MKAETYSFSFFFILFFSDITISPIASIHVITCNRFPRLQVWVKLNPNLGSRRRIVETQS